MAFTGTPVIEQISDRCVRVTGVSLATAATGVIQLAAGTTGGAVLLPASFKPVPYKYDPTGNTVSLQESVRVTVVPVTTVGTAGLTLPVSVVKTGTTNANFTITFTNTTSAGGAASSSGMEIYIEFRD